MRYPIFRNCPIIRACSSIWFIWYEPAKMNFRPPLTNLRFHFDRVLWEIVGITSRPGTEFYIPYSVGESSPAWTHALKVASAIRWNQAIGIEITIDRTTKNRMIIFCDFSISHSKLINKSLERSQNSFQLHEMLNHPIVYVDRVKQETTFIERFLTKYF